VEIRKTPGKCVPNGRKHNVWHCAHCDFKGTTGTWKAPDGEEGHWCYVCAKQGIKSPLKTIQVDSLDWVCGKVEVKCCGEWLDCSGFTNTCYYCGCDYNHAGQQLAPRHMWGEETGETVAEILMI